jgi:hypothetical protein
MDEAIREHLALKRKLGASEDELERKENEAFGRGATGAAAASTPPSDVAEPTPAPADSVDEEMEPAEVLPEDSLQVDSAPTARIEEPGLEPLVEPEPEDPADLSEGFDDVDPSDDLPPAEDPLEGTPEFLEQSPDQERLWFEQGPPKDFNFDD